METASRLRDTGLDRMPFTSFSANQAWLELVLAAADLVAWLRLDGELAKAEPKSLRYRLLYVAGRIVRRARRVVLRLPAHWPWAADLDVHVVSDLRAPLREAVVEARLTSSQGEHLWRWQGDVGADDCVRVSTVRAPGEPGGL